ncbi:hypothetical protein THIOM_000479 [Candidatus Thiomargarita nelsonii]|uniref:Uncharacterized protein n=1 Tax=Candidatus Thiomargarita nelsonii TaxID=1003181 RepID=A0A176S6C0_9GAMM|nr:hypothetical protein THIOM_000479 [Candidatus Thiomargarita nelsonii]
MLQITIYKCRQLRLRKRTDFSRLDFTLLKKYQSGNTTNTIFRRRISIFINIKLGNFQFTRIFLCNFIQNGGNHLAGTTPIGPIIN